MSKHPHRQLGPHRWIPRRPRARRSPCPMHDARPRTLPRPPEDHLRVGVPGPGAPGRLDRQHEQVLVCGVRRRCLSTNNLQLTACNYTSVVCANFRTIANNSFRSLSDSPRSVPLNLRPGSESLPHSISASTSRDSPPHPRKNCASCRSSAYAIFCNVSSDGTVCPFSTRDR